MTDATDHALEQAERIVQYAKYSDRFMVVEGNSAAERRAFVKLIGQKLPRQVRPVVLRADAGNGASALIAQLGTLLHLPAGIETFEQLISAATDALAGQDRLLIVLENADHWLDSDGSSALFDLINQAHDLARERILFLLIGASGLCERVETAQPLAALVADLHCAQLLGTASQPRASAAAAAPDTTSPTDMNKTAAAEPAPATTRAPTPPAPARRSSWASPTLLIAIIVSIAVVSVGAFALLGRTQAPTTKSAETTTDTTSKEASVDEANTPTESNSDQPDEAPNEAAMSEPAPDENTQPDSSTGTPDQSTIDHGQPLFVPFPEEKPTPATTDEATATEETPTDSTPIDESATEAAEPVTEEARGEAAATPPAGVDNSWYRDQPRARAAIQMAAFGRLDDANKMIERFVSDNQPRDKWRIYTQKIDGKILYTVTLGDFPSAERARHAIDELPADLQKLKPYPRSVGAIQDRLADATP